jgi:hypothetical protein
LCGAWQCAAPPGAGAARRGRITRYLNKPKKITPVISANAINSVLWPHRATIPTMFQSPEFTRFSRRRRSALAHDLYGVGTVHFQGLEGHAAGHKNGGFRALAARKIGL